MAKKSNIQETINFIEYMNIQINYRDNIFLKGAGIQKQSVKNSGKSGVPKITYTFDDIISKIPSNTLKDLEKKYQHKKRAYGEEANKRLVQYVPDAKEQIAGKFEDFISEVNSFLNDFVTNDNSLAVLGGSIINSQVTPAVTSHYYGILEKASSSTGNRRGLHLVYDELDKADVIIDTKYYDDGSEAEKEDFNSETVPSNSSYQFSSLPILLDTIARVTTDYCKAADKANNVYKEGEGQRGQVTPLFIRQTCAWVCYTLLYFGDTLSKLYLHSDLSKQSGVCTQIMHDLHLRTKHDYKYEYFAKEKKLLEYTKWSILPEVILREGNFVAPISPVSYAGHKDGYLGFMLSELVEQRKFKTYLEPFGGSGVAISQFPKKKSNKYLISDASYLNICYYKMLIHSTDAEFNDFITKVEEFQGRVNDLYSLIDNLYIKGADKDYKKKFEKIDATIKRINCGHLYVQDKGFDISKLTDANICDFWGMPNLISDSRFSRMKNEALTAIEVSYALRELYRPYYNLYDFCGQNITALTKAQADTLDWIECAVAFVVLHTSLVSGQVSINQSLLSQPTLRNMNIRRQLEMFKTRYKNIDIVDYPNNFGVDAIGMLLNPDFNNVDILSYLDSPYLYTAGYADKNSWKLKDITPLVNNCVSYKGDFIYSCRINAKEEPTSKDDSKNAKEIKKLNNIKIKKDFVTYFKLFQQLKSKGKECKVLLMVKSFDYDDLKLSKKEYEYLLENGVASLEYLYICYCLKNANELEAMITNFDFKTPNFSKFRNFVDVYKRENILTKNGNDDLMINTTFKPIKPEDKTSHLFDNIFFTKIDIDDLIKVVSLIYN